MSFSDIKYILSCVSTKDKCTFTLTLPKLALAKILGRYVYWQPLVAPVRINGVRVRYYGELVTFSQLHESKEMLDVFTNKKYAQLLEIGMHTGRIAWLFATTHPKGKVISYEPNPNSAKIYAAHVSSHPNIKAMTEIRQAAISDKEGTLKFYLTSKTGGCSSLIKPEKYYKEITVPVKNLDQEEVNLTKKTLIKIDAEGVEEAVLKGMKNKIRKSKPDMVVEHNTQQAKRTFTRLANQLGYTKSIKLDDYNWLYTSK